MRTYTCQKYNFFNETIHTHMQFGRIYLYFLLANEKWISNAKSIILLSKFQFGFPMPSSGYMFF